MVFAGLRVVRVQAVIKFVLRAASTLENKDSEQHALREFYAGRNFSFIKRNVLHQVQLIRALYSHYIK